MSPKLRGYSYTPRDGRWRKAFDFADPKRPGIARRTIIVRSRDGSIFKTENQNYRKTTATHEHYVSSLAAR